MARVHDFWHTSREKSEPPAGRRASRSGDPHEPAKRRVSHSGDPHEPAWRRASRSVTDPHRLASKGDSRSILDSLPPVVGWFESEPHQSSWAASSSASLYQGLGTVLPFMTARHTDAPDSPRTRSKRAVRHHPLLTQVAAPHHSRTPSLEPSPWHAGAKRDADQVARVPSFPVEAHRSLKESVLLSTNQTHKEPESVMASVNKLHKYPTSYLLKQDGDQHSHRATLLELPSPASHREKEKLEKERQAHAHAHAPGEADAGGPYVTEDTDECRSPCRSEAETAPSNNDERDVTSDTEQPLPACGSEAKGTRGPEHHEQGTHTPRWLSWMNQHMHHVRTRVQAVRTPR